MFRASARAELPVASKTSAIAGVSLVGADAGEGIFSLVAVFQQDDDLILTRKNM